MKMNVSEHLQAYWDHGTVMYSRFFQPGSLSQEVVCDLISHSESGLSGSDPKAEGLQAQCTDVGEV